jgi:catechol 2,3-dioxygenase-like lactoylglutathione lyase family enzyme
MPATLRCEIFPADLDATAAFYVDVLGFEIVRDERDREAPYLALRRGDVQLGAARRPTVAEDVTARPWGLRDFRLLDPDGWYWRLTTRA